MSTGEISYTAGHAQRGLPPPEKWKGLELAKTIGLKGYTYETMIEDSKKLVGFETPRYASINLTDPIDVFTLKEFAYGHGDANPLYTDPDYAKNSRYGCLIAAPTFVSVIRYPVQRGVLDWGPYPLTGFPATQDWTFYDVIRVNDRFRSSMKQDEVFEKRGRTGRLAFTNIDATLWNQTDRVIATCEGMFISVGAREGWVDGEGFTGKGGMLYERPTYHYSKEEVEKIVGGIKGEERRGATPRFWEDVNVGDKLTPVVKPPYLFMDFITESIATHFIYHPSFEMSVEDRGLEFRFNPVTGWPYESRVMEHWDFNLCRGRGLPGPFDLGVSRVAKNEHFISNWMGDDGFMRRLNSSIRKPNYYGDTLWFSGEVVDKYKDEVEGVEYAAVDIIISCMNPVGENCLPGKATVYLPSRELGEVTLPIPTPSPENWKLMTKRDVNDFINEIKTGETIQPHLPVEMKNYNEWLDEQRKKQ